MILHLSVMLIAAQLTFLIGVDRTSPVLGCRVTALLLQYFLLSAFMVCYVLQSLKHRLSDCIFAYSGCWWTALCSTAHLFSFSTADHCLGLVYLLWGTW